MKILSKNEKNQITHQKSKITSRYFVKFTKESIPVYKLAQQALNGQIDLQKFPFTKLDLVAKKMDGHLAKLRPKAEQKLKKLGAKSYRYKDRTKRYMKMKYKRIPKIVRQAIKASSMNFRVKESSLASTGSLPLTGALALKPEVGSENDPLYKDRKAIADNSINSSSVLDAQRQANEALISKSYKVNDLHPAHDDIWKVISARYLIIHKRLSKSAISEGSFKSEKASLRKSLLGKLKLF